jgi:hypothetical protein
MTDVPPTGHGPEAVGRVANPLRLHAENRESTEAPLVDAITSSRGAAVSDERCALILLAALATRDAATSTGDRTGGGPTQGRSTEWLRGVRPGGRGRRWFRPRRGDLRLQGKRDDVILATKINNQMTPAPNHGGNSRRWIMRAVEASLRRLGTATRLFSFALGGSAA